MYQWATQEAATVQCIPNPSTYFILKKKKILCFCLPLNHERTLPPCGAARHLQEQPPRLQNHFGSLRFKCQLLCMILFQSFAQATRAVLAEESQSCPGVGSLQGSEGPHLSPVVSASEPWPAGPWRLAQDLMPGLEGWGVSVQQTGPQACTPLLLQPMRQTQQKKQDLCLKYTICHFFHFFPPCP